jgi:hypothetical protein
MRTSPFVLAAALFAAPMLAQSNPNPFIVFPQDPERQPITAASYVRRPNWNAAGEGFQEVPQNLFRGVGDVGGGLSLAYGFYHWCADLENSTPELYDVLLRNADVTGTAPDTTPTGIIVQVVGLSTPTGTGGNSGWIMTDLFATPAVLPQNATWYQGLSMAANPSWPSGSPPDGYSIWAADTLAAGTPATVGENGRFSATPVTWNVTPAGNANRTQWTYIMGTLIDQPTLHVGGIDPLSSRTGVLGASSYGMNGLFPDISGLPRSDGLDLRMQDNALPNGIAVFAASFGWWPGPAIPVGFGGDLYLDATTLVLLGFALPVGGAATLPLLPPGSIAPTFIGSELMFQGLWLDPVTGGGRMTNAQVTAF